MLPKADAKQDFGSNYLNVFSKNPDFHTSLLSIWIILDQQVINPKNYPYELFEENL